MRFQYCGRKHRWLTSYHRKHNMSSTPDHISRAGGSAASHDTVRRPKVRGPHPAQFWGAPQVEVPTVPTAWLAAPRCWGFKLALRELVGLGFEPPHSRLVWVSNSPEARWVWVSSLMKTGGFGFSSTFNTRAWPGPARIPSSSRHSALCRCCVVAL